MYILTGEGLGKLSTTSPKQLTPEQKLVQKINRAIGFMQKAAPLLQTQAQRELLIATIDVLTNFFPKGYGVINTKGNIVKRSKRFRIEVIDKKSMSIPKPFIFIYDMQLFLSHEKPDAHGRHMQIGNRGSQIRLYVRALAGSSVNRVGGTVIHEMVHMWHDMHRSLAAKLGTQVAGAVPTSAAAALLDVRSFDPHRRIMEKRFSVLVNYLNQQPQRVGYSLASDVAILWADHLVEEVLAHIYTTRVTFAIATIEAKKQGIAMSTGFVPMQFLKEYFRHYWLQDSNDRAALDTATAQQILGGLEADLKRLVSAVEAHVGA